MGSGNTDVPDLIGPGQTQDPHNPGPNGANTYFLPDAFTSGPYGQFGNANRRFFSGPGIANWDCSLLKDTRITEKTSIQFRAEFFNVLNHTQFNNPSGNFSGDTLRRGHQRPRPAHRPVESQVPVVTSRRGGEVID